MSTMPDVQVLITLGVDTTPMRTWPRRWITWAASFGTLTVPTTTRGFNDLVEWASGFGVIDRIRVEGTGCSGAGLARWLREEGFVIIEVDRPSWRTRRRHGKSDTVDALRSDRHSDGDDDGDSASASLDPASSTGLTRPALTLSLAFRTRS